MQMHGTSYTPTSDANKTPNIFSADSNYFSNDHAMQTYESLYISILDANGTSNISSADLNYFSNDHAMQTYESLYIPILNANDTPHALIADQTFSYSQQSPHYTMQMYEMQHNTTSNSIVLDQNEAQQSPHLSTQNPSTFSNNHTSQGPCFLPKIRIDGTFITSTTTHGINPSEY
ncbi:hypothetical protein ACJ72_08780 [Emergomyces africanus]|uniref:Uncharacterized protein n=1 Tax=Emergomyces africanus TaxID=1955775 RepID=A0A1B7NJZ6_9EURO|nr:hypothetical protein ACJ72_08780 [Emergomyces africanus]